VGLRHPDDLDAWRGWHERRHPLRLVRGRVRALLPGRAAESLVDVRRGGPDADLLVAVEATHASVSAAVIDVLRHLDPARVVVVSPRGAALPIDLPAARVPLTAIGAHLGKVARVLAAGHYTPIGTAAHAHAQTVGARFLVSQHGLLTPLAPPLPPEVHLLAWSEADADFWASGRHDVSRTVVGSQLLWNVAEPTEPATEQPMYLGQLHAAELGRRDLERAARAFCLAHDATYRPHPSERDQISRLVHARWERRGIRLDPGTVPLAQVSAPVVSVFSTGVLEAAARGLPAWVDFPHPPRWLRDFWDRYGMRTYGGHPTPAPPRPDAEPAAVIARILAAES